MQSSKEQYDKAFEYQQEYDEKIKRQAELNVLLDLENQKILVAIYYASGSESKNS